MCVFLPLVQAVSLNAAYIFDNGCTHIVISLSHKSIVFIIGV